MQKWLTPIKEHEALMIGSMGKRDCSANVCITVKVTEDPLVEQFKIEKES